jgi:tetratricopeptide (TPR) repeat protein
MKFKPGAIAAFIAALAIATIAQNQKLEAQADGPGRTWAVIVGISKYQKLPGGQQLQFADRDAIAFADAIKKIGVRPENIRLLVGADAPASAIKGALGNWLARSVAETDTVLFFFSGHGYYEQEFGESYLFGYDADAKDPFNTALSVSEIQQAISRRIRARHVLVVTDAVRRDFFDPDTNGAATATEFINSFNQLATRAGVSVIAASGPGEFSREGQRWSGQGVFTKHFIDALSGNAERNPDGAITADKVFDQVAVRVANDTSNKQRPWRSNTALAQIVLSAGERRSSTPAIAATTEPIAKAVITVPSATPPDQLPVAASTTTTRPAPAVARNEPVATQPVNDKSRPGEQPKADAAVSSSSGGTATIKESPPRSSPTDKAVKKSAEQSAPKSPAPVATSTTQPVSSSSTTVFPSPKNATAPRSSSSTNAATPAAASSTRMINPETASSSASTPTGSPAAVKSRAPTPPMIATNEVSGTAIHLPAVAAPRAGDIASLPTPPRPVVVLPGVASVGAAPDKTQPVSVASTISATRPEVAPTPLILELEAAIAKKNLLEPKGASAWDLYQRFAADSGATSEAGRLKFALADALAASGREIVAGDVRTDTITDKTDDFRRAGQMLARARSLKPENTELSTLEKLCAAQALIALQFYDEAERALTPLQNTKLAAVDNAMGLVYQGKLDTWRAERAFKRALDVEPNWAAPHYNLALLYRGQQNDQALEEFERAAALDGKNADLLLALGDEYFARQQWPRAVETYRKAVALKPADDTLHTKLGHALYSLGQQDEANREYQKARDLRSKRP